MTTTLQYGQNYQGGTVKYDAQTGLPLQPGQSTTVQSPQTTTAPQGTTLTQGQSFMGGTVKYDAQTGLPLAQGQTTTLPPVPVAPTNVSAITPTPSFNLPQVNPSTPGINGVDGMIAYYNSQFQTAQQQAADYQKQLDAAKAQQQQQTQPFLSKILGSKSPSQVQSDTFSKIGINPTQYFANEQAQIAEISSLTQDYNNSVAQRDAQIAATNDKLASNDFINNQIAQINRNAAVVLNSKAAIINSKAAALQASQGMFQEAQNYVNQAVDAATADYKYNVDMFNEFYQLNQDTIDNLDKKYQTALNDAKDAATQAWTLQVDEKNKIGDLILSNPGAGITMNDTLDQAYTKLARAGGTLDTQFKQQQINTEKLQQQKLRSDIALNTQQLSQADAQSWAAAIQSGTVKLSDVPTKLKTQVIGLIGTTQQSQAQVSPYLQLTNSLLSDKNLKYVTGTGRLSFQNIVPGTKAQYTKNQLNQLISSLSLENRQKLKGSGAISDYESRLLNSAASSINKNLSVSDLTTELKKVQGVFQAASGLPVQVKITDPNSGESKTGSLFRDGIDSAAAQGFIITYL